MAFSINSSKSTNRSTFWAVVRAMLLIGLGVVIDQFTKAWASAQLPDSPIDIIPKALSLVYVENHNAVFGLGGSIPDAVRRWGLLAMSSVLAVVLLVAMVRSTDFASRLGFGLTVAGAIGNIIDRAHMGYVVDFIYWHGGFSWPNFNVADMMVCVGIGVLLVFGNRKNKGRGVKLKTPSLKRSGS